MSRNTRHTDTSLLAAALRGYEGELARVNTAIAALQKRLGSRGRGGNVSNPFTKARVARKRRRLSPEGRARIAAAQRKRWEAVRKGK